MSHFCVGFIGAGQMARALALGMTDAGIVSAGELRVFDPSPDAMDGFAADVPDAGFVADNQEVANQSQVVILAVKPHIVPIVADELTEVDFQDRLVVSIAAGISLAELSARFRSTRIVRVMPNTPCLVRAGAAGFCAGAGTVDGDTQWVNRMLQSVGLAFEVPEPQLDAVTGLSGSGPAYIFMVIEALSDGGVRMGLPRHVATALATQTVLGAATLAANSEVHAAVLRERVTSPGGTTIAGLQTLEDRGLRGALIGAVEAAAKRAQQLGEAKQ